MPHLRPVLAMGTALALVLLGTAALLFASPSPWAESLSAPLEFAPRSLMEADGQRNAAPARHPPAVTILAHTDPASAPALPVVPAAPALGTQPASDAPGEGARDSFFSPPTCDRVSGAPALFRPTDLCSPRALSLAAGTIAEAAEWAARVVWDVGLARSHG